MNPINQALGMMVPQEWFQSFYFVIAVDNIKYGAFSECVLPNLTVKTEDVREGGQNTYTHKLPVNVDVGTFTLKRGITRDLYFLRWYLQVMNGDIAQAMRTVTVLTYDSLNIPLATYTFARAYPTKWRGPSLKASESAIAVEEIEFVHHGFEVM